MTIKIEKADFNFFFVALGNDLLYSSYLFQTIKLEPSTAGVSTETWEGSNQSYEDGGGSSSGPGVVASAGDPMTMPLPLHSDIAESSQLHDSSRVSVDSFCMILCLSLVITSLFSYPPFIKEENEMQLPSQDYSGSHIVL